MGKGEQVSDEARVLMRVAVTAFRSSALVSFRLAQRQHRNTLFLAPERRCHDVVQTRHGHPPLHLLSDLPELGVLGNLVFEKGCRQDIGP